MSIKDLLSGYVLQPSRNATSNSTQTASAINGVLRDISDIPLQHINLFGETLASQYRCAFLDQPYGTEEEYLIWAANNSNMALVEDPSWEKENAVLFFGNIGNRFTNEIGVDYPSTSQIYIDDANSRSIKGVTKVYIRRGDYLEVGLPVDPIELVENTHFTYEFGVIALNSAGESALGGGLSEERGDELYGATYYLERSRFWWSRNDTQKTRFKWSDKEGRWEPLKGQGVLSLGKLLPNETYALSPKLTDLELGTFLKGSVSDKKAFLRLGTQPSEGAIPIRVKVISDDLVKDDYDFAGDTDNPDGVIGQQENKIIFNPNYVTTNAGNIIWYAYPNFQEKVGGIVGNLIDADSLFICPIPSLFERPMIRIGSRKHLIAIPTLNEAELSSLVIPNEKTFGWCASTGKLKFHQDLIDKADQEASGFDINFLGAQVLYDGISLNQESIETAKPVELTDLGDNDYTIPYAIQGDVRTSGLLKTPDGTGITPTSSTIDSPRPSEGLLLDIHGIGDTLFFGKSFAFDKVVVERTEEEIPSKWFRKRNTIYVALDTKKAFVSNRAAKTLNEEGLFFAQGDLTPARIIKECRMPSRRILEYQVTFGDVFVFALKNGLGSLNTYTWTCTASGTHTAEEMAEILNTETAGLATNGDGLFTVVDEHLCLETTSRTGRIEIGFGLTSGDYKDRDLSGCASLGFNAGWILDTQNEIYALNDSGFSFGMFRSPKDRGQVKGFPDFKQIRQLETPIGSPASFYFQVLDKTPLEDEIGFEPSVFFRLQLGLLNFPLRNYERIVHNFGENNFIWCAYTNMPATQVLQQTNTTNLNPPVIPKAMTPHLGTGIYLSDGGSTATLLVKDQNYLLRDGQQGIVEHIDIQNERLAEGAAGTCSGDSFYDAVGFSGISVGNRLKILSGENKGSYYIDSNDGVNLIVKPPFLVNSLFPTESWEIYEGVDLDSYDPSLIADKLFVPTSHLKEEPFKVRVITALGEVATLPATFEFEGFEILDKGRVFYFQVGGIRQDATQMASYQIGKVENDVLKLNEDEYLQEGRFSLTLGTSLYSIDLGNIVQTNAFTEPLVGNIIEIGEHGSAIAGEIKFGDEALALYGGQQVLYSQTFREIDEIQYNLNQVYVSGLNGVVEIVEEMVLNEDVTLAPITGTIAFNEILKKNKQVEVDYFVADTDGTRRLDADGQPLYVNTRLPVSYKLQPTTRIDKYTYEFNAENRTIDRNGTIRIWRGSYLMNLNGKVEATVDLANNRIEFVEPIENEATIVQINYFAYESSGKERAYQTPSFPIWRPPFKIEKDVSQFEVWGDKTSEFTQGKIVLIGGACFYVTGATYSNDFTTIDFYPATTEEHGSNAPASEQGLFISDRALDENDGFWFDANHIEFENVDKGMNKLVLVGNHYDLLTINHVFDLSGEPYLVEAVSLSEDGSYTLVTFQAPFSTAYERSEDTLKISTRPIYFVGGSDFIAKPFVSDQPYELILGGTTENGVELPARTLVEEVEYKIDPETGVISFIPLFLSGIAQGQSLYFYSVVRKNISPKMENGNLIVPVVLGRYLSAIIPNGEGEVLAKYKHLAPDSFYSRVVLNSTQMSEIASDFSASMRTAHSGGGSLFAFDTNNHTKGSLDERGKLQESLRKDQAARLFVDLYNQIIRGFEQIRETITGGFIGDRDGKFKFFIGRNEDFTPNGYEDPFSGIYNPRNTWNIYFNKQRKRLGLSRIPFLEDDSIVDPASATLTDFVMEGDFTDMDELKEFILEQKRFLRNDIDDRVLTGRARFRLFPRRSIGSFEYMGEPHALSRLYPERTTSFTRLFSGTLTQVYGEGGVFTSGRTFDDKVRSTRRTQNGSVENPALGVITNISSLETFKRLPRARIERFSPRGLPDIDAALGLAIGERPVAIATPLLIKDFPIDNVGVPDVSRLIVNGGDLIDLTTGDYDLSTPPLEIGQQIGFGHPNGKLVPVMTSEGKGIFVKEIIEGCIITFADFQGNDITTMEEMLSALNEEPISLTGGDTIMGVTATTYDDGSGSELTEITDFEQSSALQNASPIIRGFDLGRNLKTGQYFDKTLLTEEDSTLGAFFDLQKWLGQTPPKPLECLEGIVEFSNSRTTPVALPALKGEEKDDTGDYALPYLRGGETELSILGEIAKEFEVLLDKDNFDLSSSVYPNERIGNDGVLTVFGLETSIDLTPIASSGVAYVPHTGLGDLKEGDFVLVETDDTDPKSWRGIHSVGRIGNGVIQFPRVLTRTFAGSTIQYDYYNYAVHIATATDGTGNSLNGIVVLDNGADTTFDISSISGFQLSGWMDFLNTPLDPATGGNRNAIEIKLIEHTTGTVVETITIYHDLVPATSWDRYLFSQNLGASSPVITMSIDPTEEIITFTGLTGWFDFASLGLPIGGDPNKFFDFAINIYALNDPISNTSEYNGDNLTFYSNRCQISTEFDLRKGALVEEHPNNSGLTFLATLFTGDIIANGNVLSVNRTFEINGGLPFVLTEDLLETHRITLPNQGYGNIELLGEDIRFAGVVGSTKDENGDIASGVGFCYDGLPAIIGDYQTRMSGTPLAASAGDIANIGKGDVVYIANGFDSTSGTQFGAVKTGTYLVKHAIPNDAGLFYQQKNTTFSAGTNNQKGINVSFPKVQSITSAEIVLKNTHLVVDSPTGNSFKSSGKIYVMTTSTPTLADTVEITYLSQTDLGDGIVSFEIDTSSPLVFADGNPFESNLGSLSGKACSGMAYLPVEWEYDNIVGYDDGAGTYLGGFLSIDISGTSFDVAGVTLVDVGSLTGANEIGLHIQPKISSEDFDENPYATVYDNVGTYIDISNVDWASVNALAWLDKSDTFVVDFYALGGIFFEPSIPLSSQDLNGTEEKVVDADHSLTSIGMRNMSDQVATQDWEEIEYVVSRVRRWNNSTLAIDEAIKRLPYVYEMRRGEILAGTTEDTLVTNGTQLGGFQEELVNVNFGDLVKIYNAQGELVDEAVIEAVVSDTTLSLAPPYIRNSLVLANPSDFTFEIYLRTPLIPLEQSHEELKDMMLDQVLVEGTTGKVTTRNVLEDDNQTFAGVLENDILIIDPQGALNLEDERGTRPFGDRGVPSRADYVGGPPSELDDNRGFYRVVELVDDTLLVSPVHTYAGTADNPVIFGSSLTSQEFAVLPTISSVGVDGEQEAQNDLRPTQVADGDGSFKGNQYSIEPFSYKIIRPTGLFSTEMQDYTLFHRERILSWIEELRIPMLNSKSGLYHDFQKEIHISELNDPTDTDIGLGVISNETIFSLSGETMVAPFMNTSDCVSILDRRHWCQDTRLDYLTPFGSANPFASIERELAGYSAGSGRPLQIDRIDEILDFSDQLRDLRYTWINFRTNLANGTLREAQFAQEILERNLSEQEVLIVIEESMEKL